jgi:hypothetical protein
MDPYIQQMADQTRFMLKVWLNCRVTTIVHYAYGWNDHVPAVGDVVDITNEFRAMGVIK